MQLMDVDDIDAVGVEDVVWIDGELYRDPSFDA